MRASGVVTLALYVTGAFVGVLLALLGAFAVPWRPLTGVSVGDATALLLVGPLCYQIGRAVRSPLGGVAVAVGWLVTAVYFGTKRPEGDLVLTGSAYGLAFLLLGALSAAIGIGTVRAGVVRGDRRVALREPDPGHREAHVDAEADDA